MGAVMTSRHDPVMVMEYMEYGSLYDLLRNETMPLTGEVILQITRDVRFALWHALYVDSSPFKETHMNFPTTACSGFAVLAQLKASYSSW